MYVDTPRFFSINHNGHLVTYELDLRPPPIPAPTNQSNLATTFETTHQPTLPIINPFKSIMSRSTEHLPLNENSNRVMAGGKSSKAIFADPYDMGVLLTNPTWAGLSFRRRQDGTLCGLAWAHRELTVRFIYTFCFLIGIDLSQLFEYEEQSLRILFHLPIVDVRQAGWLDHDSYAISFEVVNYTFRSECLD